jgi:hypothetical protein
MNINVNYTDTDLAKALAKIIKDSNSEEFVKLLTPMICDSSQGVNHFFKLMIGNKLPYVIPNGTLCKISINSIGYGIDKEATREKFADIDDKIVVTIKEFRGYHQYSEYVVEYTGVVAAGTTRVNTDYVSEKDLEVIEEF